MSLNDIIEIINFVRDPPDVVWGGAMLVCALSGVGMLAGVALLMLVVSRERLPECISRPEDIVLRSRRRCVTVVRGPGRLNRQHGPMRLVLTHTALVLTTPPSYLEVGVGDFPQLEAWEDEGILRVMSHRQTDKWSQIVVPVDDIALWLRELAMRGVRVRSGGLAWHV